MPNHRNSAGSLLASLACVAFCACSFGQSEVPPYRQPVQIVEGQPAKPSPANPAPATGTPSTKTPAAPSAAPSSAVPPSALNQPAQPPTVKLSPGKLIIQANNSRLSDILRQVQKDSGMKIEGLQNSGDQRIFGKYGPGAPGDVLLDLLSGSGFNVLMVGVTPSGTPRELALTSRTTGPSAGATPSPANNGQEQNQPDEEEPPPDQPAPEEQQQQINVAPPTAPPEMRRNGIPTPQQLMEQLQRMREQQQQQQEREQQQEQQQQEQ